MFESSWAHHFYICFVFIANFSRKVAVCMSQIEKNPLAFFHEEPISDRDYTMAEAVAEAKRCLNCRVPQCRNSCPIENEIPQFIHELAQGNFGAAAEYIYHRSDFPALCGRICPRETQCEGACVLGKKGKHIEI